MPLTEHDINSLHLPNVFKILKRELSPQQADQVLTEALIGIYLFITSRNTNTSYWDQLDQNPDVSTLLETEQSKLQDLTILAVLRQILEIKENQEKVAQIMTREKQHPTILSLPPKPIQQSSSQHSQSQAG